MITICKKLLSITRLKQKTVFKLEGGCKLADWFNCHFLPLKVFSP